MKFILRTHFCNKCNKKAFYLQIATPKSVEQKNNCPRCGSEVISFWEELNSKYIYPFFIGVPFFSMAAIYGFYTSIYTQIRPVDIFTMIFNIFMSAIFTVYGIRYSKLEKIPKRSDNSLEKLKHFRNQTWFAFLFTLCGLVIATITDIIIVFIWFGIERLG